MASSGLGGAISANASNDLGSGNQLNGLGVGVQWQFGCGKLREQRRTCGSRCEYRFYDVQHDYRLAVPNGRAERDDNFDVRIRRFAGLCRTQ